MKGWISACLVALAACQVQPEPEPATTQVEQGLVDCTPGGNFPNAHIIPVPYFNGKSPPQPLANQMWVLFNNPYNANETIAFIADYAQGKLVYGTRIANQSINVLMVHIGGEPTIRGGNNPPPPPPPCPGCDDDYYARYALELALRASALPGFAASAAKLPWP